MSLSYSRILSLYLPLAASWILMALEMPTAVYIIAKGNDAKVETAGLLIVMMVSLFIESPVIDLLSTATKFVTDKLSLHGVRRFAWFCILLTGGLHALVAATPIYDWVTLQLLGLPQNVAEASRWPLIFMILWSPAIGYRRWLQGLLIRSGNTRRITFGTVLRLATVWAVGLSCVSFTSLTGLESAAAALSLSVLAEAIYMHFASQSMIRELEAREGSGTSVNLRQIYQFHAPLTLATLITLSSTPILGAFLSRTDQAVTQLAGWQTAMAIGFVFRTITFAIPEVIIALSDEPRASSKLRRFSLLTGALMSCLMLLFTSTGWIYTFFVAAQSAPLDVAETATLAFLWTAPLPFFSAALSYVRGRLAWARYTAPRVYGIIAGIICMAITFEIGLQQAWKGVIAAALALLVGHVVDLAVQAVAWQNRRKRQATASA